MLHLFNDSVLHTIGQRYVFVMPQPVLGLNSFALARQGLTGMRSIPSGHGGIMRILRSVEFLMQQAVGAVIVLAVVVEPIGTRVSLLPAGRVIALQRREFVAIFDDALLDVVVLRQVVVIRLIHTADHVHSGRDHHGRNRAQKHPVLAPHQRLDRGQWFRVRHPAVGLLVVEVIAAADEAANGGPVHFDAIVLIVIVVVHLVR
mmetsp:Transcript_22912/g.64916  ORF Transcript_22912/g.64916 Transcript_22912/m.64916 type:complete len:203 (-) Transcript_22912:48-656(-)